MPQDALVNTGAQSDAAVMASARVAEIQAKLHRWAAADPGRQFQDLFNLVADPAFLLEAWRRVRGNTGARSAGIDGRTAVGLERREDGVADLLAEIRADLRDRSFRPVPVRATLIPKPNGKKRRLGIPTVKDRVVQAALKLVLEPIFEVGFSSSSYGFRPGRRAQDAIEDIRHHARLGYRWVFETDIANCFDEIDHTALMDRVRRRVADKKVLALVKAFCKAGILSEDAFTRTDAGTPQGAILSPLLANIALSVIDEHFDAKWTAHGGSDGRRAHRRRGGATYRLVRYADDLAVLVFGTRDQAEALRDEVADVAAKIGLRLAEDKTRTVHIDHGMDFLGFRIQRHQQWGRGRWFVYTYPTREAIKRVRAKVKAITSRQTLNQDPHDVFVRLGHVLRGWTTYYRHAAAATTFSTLEHYVWHRVWKWLRRKHYGKHWRWIVRTYRPPGYRWWRAPTGHALFNPAKVRIQRYRYRGNVISTPWTPRPATA